MGASARLAPGRGRRRLSFEEGVMTQGNGKFGVGMVLGLVVGMLIYRVLFG